MWLLLSFFPSQRAHSHPQLPLPRTNGYSSDTQCVWRGATSALFGSLRPYPVAEATLLCTPSLDRSHTTGRIPHASKFALGIPISRSHRLCMG